MIRAICRTAALAISLPIAVAWADNAPNVPVRVGSHDGFGRVVFDLPSQTDYHISQQGQRVVVLFTGDVTIGAAPRPPRNVIGITGGSGQAELVVAPGTTLRDWRLGDRLVIDILARDAPATDGLAPQQAGAAKPAAKPAPTTPAQSAPAGIKTPATAPPATSPPPQAGPPQAGPPQAAVPTAAPPAVSTTRPEPAPPKTETAPASPSSKAEATAPPAEISSATTPTQPAPEPAASPSPRQAPTTSVASSAADDIANGGSDFVMPADSQLGIAAFRRGNIALIVLDQPHTIDLTRWRDDRVFGGSTVQTLPTATVIRIPLDPSMTLVPSRTADGWRIAPIAHEPDLQPILTKVTDDRLVLQAGSPGMVVTVIDPDTGATLLVGTQRRDGQGVPTQRRSPEFILVPTWQGVVLEPNADTVALRPTPQGFVVAGTRALSPQSDTGDQLAHAAGLTRRFDFPNQANAALLERLQRQMTADASAPPRARGPHRDALARTMIALGLGVEAGSLLRLAATDDPQLADSPDNAVLASIAALLAGRSEEATGLASADPAGADDIAFWRAVRLAQLDEGTAQAASMFAATLPLLLGYPAEMRDRLLPLVAETLIGGGETASAATLLASRKDDATLDLARAMLLEAHGDSTAAIAAYDRLASSRDQSVHARAATRAVDLRLTSGQIDAKQATDRLEALLYAWRGDRHERALRDRLAALKVRTGVWRSALNTTRESETLFPEAKAAIHANLEAMFADLLRDEAISTLAPLELVAAVEENADLLPSGPNGEALQARLADRLVTLDLPKRAGPVLEKLIQAATSDVARAGFGARLAALRLRESDPAGALTALDASVASGLPSELSERRTLLAATANARRGDGERALSALSALDSAAADEARATILERANDWPAAEKALTDYAAKAVPREGNLDEAQQGILLRLAAAAARAGDDATLATLRRQESPRMAAGPVADMFRLLTAEQVRSVADLKRSGQEAALARALPAQLKALQAPARLTP